MSVHAKHQFGFFIPVLPLDFLINFPLKVVFGEKVAERFEGARHQKNFDQVSSYYLCVNRSELWQGGRERCFPTVA